MHISLYSLFLILFYEFSLRASDLSNTGKFTCHSWLDLTLQLQRIRLPPSLALLRILKVCGFSIRADLYIVYLRTYLCVYFIEDHEDVFLEMEKAQYLNSLLITCVYVNKQLV